MSVLMCHSHVAIAQDVSEELKSRVAALVAQLNSPKLQLRNQAESELIRLGPEAMSLLKLQPGASSGTKTAINRIRQQLWQKQARQSVQQSWVDCEGVQTVEHLVKRIQATNNQLTVRLKPELQNRPLKIDARRLSFWMAVEQLREFGIEATVREKLKALYLTSEDAGISQNSYPAGPFRIFAEPSIRPDFSDPQKRRLRVRFRLQTEPRLKPLFLSLKGSDLSVKDQAGNIVSPVSPSSSLELPVGGDGLEVAFDRDFQLAKSTVKSISVAGRWKMQIAGAREVFQFIADEASIGARRKKAGVTIGVEQLQRIKTAGQEDLSVVVSVSYAESGRAFESHRNWLGLSDIRLKSSEREIAAEKMEVELQAGGSAWVRYTFAMPAAKGKLQLLYTAPTLITDVDIPVEIQNLSVKQRR